jgi:hypothetical protein
MLRSLRVRVGVPLAIDDPDHEPTMLLLVLVFLLVVVVAAAAFATGYYLAAARVRRLALPPALPRHANPLDASAASGTAVQPTRVAFTPHAPEGTVDWERAMAELGERMRDAGVRLVVFAHGSFVGDDPLALARWVEEAVPALPEAARKLRALTRAHVSRLVGDLSNYTADYVTAFARATGVDAVEFTWSGENHHAARVHGAVRLARVIALHGGGVLRPGDRALLVGHSHGGQLFAILSQLVARSQGYEDLVAAARARGEDLGALEDHLALLRRCSIDVATFGTPPRYGWGGGAPFRLLHVINHRGTAPRMRSLLGVLHTREGDYVHQLGANGSDFPAPVARDRRLNAHLDRVFGKGRDVRAWLRHLAGGQRVPPEGHTVLVDYGDEARTLPNFLATGLGHAAYTRREAMLFHARLVANHFYPPGTSVTRPANRLSPWVTPNREG